MSEKARIKSMNKQLELQRDFQYCPQQDVKGTYKKDQN